MKKKYLIQDLLGHDLHMAVAICLGYEPSKHQIWQHKDDPHRILNIDEFTPSTDAHQAHNIIEEFWIGTDRPSRGQTPPIWRALSNYRGERLLNPMGNVVGMWGPTHLIAAMRCFVGVFYFEKIEMNIPAARNAA